MSQDAGNPEAEVAVAVFAAANQMDAEIIRATLEAEGIPAAIGEQVTEFYAPILQVSEGMWGKVVVPAVFAGQARQLIADLQEGKGRVSEEELADAAERFATENIATEQ
jgi:hypothetical protein